MLIIRAPAEFEPINGLRCAEPLLSERESAARARSVYTHHEPKFGAAPRFRDFDKKHPKSFARSAHLSRHRHYTLASQTSGEGSGRHAGDAAGEGRRARAKG